MSTMDAPIKVFNLQKMLRDEGWVETRQRGSHQTWCKGAGRITLTANVKDSDPAQTREVLRKIREFRDADPVQPTPVVSTKSERKVTPGILDYIFVPKPVRFRPGVLLLLRSQLEQPTPEQTDHRPDDRPDLRWLRRGGSRREIR